MGRPNTAELIEAKPDTGQRSGPGGRRAVDPFLPRIWSAPGATGRAALGRRLPEQGCTLRSAPARGGVAAGRIRRQLVAVLVADMAGYSRLIERDDLGTVRRIRALRMQLIEPMAALYRAFIVRHAGDGILMAFRDPTSAVGCAVAVQKGIRVLQRHVPADSRFQLRMGIDVADALVVDGDLHGNGVNVAARLEEIAEPGDVYISQAVFDQVRESAPIRCELLGLRQLKNIAAPVGVYRIARDELISPPGLLRPPEPAQNRAFQADLCAAG